MRVTRIHSDGDGVSHFEDLDVELQAVQYAPPAPAIDISAPFAAARAVLSSFPAGWFGDWHPSPARQFYFSLSGRLEVEVSDGETRHFETGDVVLVEDLTGVGHTTRVIGDEASTGVFVQLRDGESVA